MFAENQTMKTAILILLVSLSTLANAQTLAERIQNGKPPKIDTLTAGQELRLMTKKLYGGMGLTALGSGMVMFGAFIDYIEPYYTPEGTKVFYVLGGGAAIAGMILSATSFIHIGRAGIKLDAGPSSVTLRIPINR